MISTAGFRFILFHHEEHEDYTKVTKGCDFRAQWVGASRWPTQDEGGVLLKQALRGTVLTGS